jgi:hypothetical protein
VPHPWLRPGGDSLGCPARRHDLPGRVALCILSRLRTQKAASEVRCLPKSAVSDDLHRIVIRVRTGHRIQALVSTGIDEVSYKKCQNYLTWVYSRHRSKVLWVAEGKGRETIDRLLTEVAAAEGGHPLGL